MQLIPLLSVPVVVEDEVTFHCPNGQQVTVIGPQPYGQPLSVCVCVCVCDKSVEITSMK